MLHAALLDTLPGWPHADNPSVLAVLLLLFGLPLALGAIIAVAGMGKRWRTGDGADAYAPDVRIAMAKAHAESEWADAHAGDDADRAEPLTEGRVQPELAGSAQGAHVAD